MTTYHVTERAEFKLCRRRWDYGSPNRQNLERKMPPVALALGTLIHEALNAWWQFPQLDLTVHFDVLARIARKEIEGRYHTEVGMEISPIEWTPFDKLVALGTTMLKGYQDYYQTPWPTDHEPISFEQVILVPIHGTPHTLSGKLDKITRDSRGYLWVWDHKSFDKHPSTQELDTTDQFLGYLTMLHLLYPTEPIGGVVYDGLWKRDHIPKGRTVDDLFMRRRIYRNVHAMNEWLDNLQLEFDDMSSDPKIYPARSWTCSMCSFRELCIAQTNGEDTAYLRETLYQQRERQDTDEVEA